MTEFSSSGQSVWLATVRIEERAALADDLQVDVCVIGAGIAGMTTAYLLAKEGKSVAVIEDGSIGGGMTGFTTAHLMSALDDRYFQLERYHGEDGARLAAASHRAAIDTIERIIGEERIDCDFRRLDGYLFAPPNDDSDDIEREYEAARRAGLSDVRKVEAAPIAGFNTGPALLFPRQGQFHPLKYLDGLARAFERLGGKIFCKTHARAVSGGDNACVITENGDLIAANAIVVATNVPINDLFAIHTKQAPYTSYVIGARIPRGSVATALYWDTRQSADDAESGEAPYHYVRLADGEPGASGDSADDVLIVGGEDHKSGQAHDGAERFGRLESWARERWPQLGEVLFRWSGQVMEPNDGMAFIGHNPIDNSNIYVATGDSGTGMTHGTIAGLLLSDLICSRPNPWQKLYDPGRVTLRAAGDFVKENVNVALQYAKGFLGSGEAGNESDIAPGEGAVLRKGLRKIAVYRDPDGAVHEMSAVCPHLGCVVAWNAVEKTWDCPCHGSRFDCMGAVVNGPANKGLEARAERQ